MFRLHWQEGYMPDPRTAPEPRPWIAGTTGAALYTDIASATTEDDFCEALPFLTRLLLVALGPRATFDLINMFRNSQEGEAREFIDYVRARQLPVPHIGSVLDFEAALHAMQGRSAECIVRFECEPSALFRALSEWTPLEALPREHFDMVVSGGGVWVVRAAL